MPNARSFLLKLAAFLAPISVISGCASSDDAPDSPPSYSLHLRGNAAFDTVGAAANSAGNSGDSYAWSLVGNGVTVLLKPLPQLAPNFAGRNADGKPAPVPAAGPAVLYLRTTASTEAESRVALLRIVTPDYRIDVSERTPDAIHIARTDTPTSVQTLQGTEHVRVSRAKNRVKVVLSAKFLQQYAPHGAAVTWFDTSPAALPDSSTFAPKPAISPAAAPISAPPKTPAPPPPTAGESVKKAAP